MFLALIIEVVICHRKINAQAKDIRELNTAITSYAIHNSNKQNKDFIKGQEEFIKKQQIHSNHLEFELEKYKDLIKVSKEKNPFFK